MGPAAHTKYACFLALHGNLQEWFLHECFFAFCILQLGCDLWAAVFVFDDFVPGFEFRRGF